MKTYHELRLDPRWQKTRLGIMKRDSFSCLSCGAKDKTLNVHHAYYVPKRYPWEYPCWSLSTLCEECHEQWHDVDKRRIKDHYYGGVFEQWEWFLSFCSTNPNELPILQRLGQEIIFMKSESDLSTQSIVDKLSKILMNERMKLRAKKQGEQKDET